jgi:hypothetical protein
MAVAVAGAKMREPPVGKGGKGAKVTLDQKKARGKKRGIGTKGLRH